MVKERYSKFSVWKIRSAVVVIIAATNRNVIAGVESVNLDQFKQGLDTVWVLLGAFLVFFMQAAFCGAAATIVAGGMAERMKFPAYLVCSFIISAFIYPIVGHWVWGGGWPKHYGTCRLCRLNCRTYSRRLCGACRNFNPDTKRR